MMKDIRGNEIKAGDIVHVWWVNPELPEETNDVICTVVRTRGRGIKFITDDGHTLTSDFLVERNAQIAIQGGRQAEEAEKKEEKAAPTRSVTKEELDMIEHLRGMGWYGTLYKRTAQHLTFHIDMPELETKK